MRSPRRARRIVSALLVLACLTVTVAPRSRAAQGPDLSERVKGSVDRGTRWLSANQNPDGGYGPYGLRVADASDLGITSFCLYALAKSPRQYKAVDGPFISRAVEFVLSRQQADGGFYDRKDPTLQNYKTSVVVLALSTLDPAKYSSAIAKAQGFLKSLQGSEAQGYEASKHLSYGGQIYGTDSLRADLSNLQYGADAMFASGLSGSDEYWRRLVVFVSRCQNAETVDPLLQDLGIGTSGDGGFRYAPNDTRGAVETLDDGTRIFSSYGSMTYAGLKSLLYAQVSKDDPRVRQAFAWISRNFTVKENPGMATKANPRAGLNGLFYYYHTMAKALAVYGEATIKDSSGNERDWARELSEHLLAIQNEDGYWVNSSERWFENIPALDTAYAIVALCECQDFLKARAARPATAAPAKEAAAPQSSGK